MRTGRAPGRGRGRPVIAPGGGFRYFFFGGRPVRCTVLSQPTALSNAFFLPPLLASPKNAVNLGRVPLGVGRYPTRQNHPKVRVLA